MVQHLRPWKTVLPINLDCGRAVYRQIADGIVEEIKRGRLKPGTPLPGTRQLADDLQVNRKTVVLAYEDLTLEGWLHSESKKGTFVSRLLPRDTKLYYKTVVPKQASNFTFNKTRLTETPIVKSKTLITFDDGLPDVRLAPMNELVRAYKRLFQQNARWRMLGYGDPKGCERIRNAIASMLAHDRGLTADKEQLCVTRGSQMALYLTAHTLVQKGDIIAVEDPGYAPAWQTFTKAGARLIPVKADEEGICAETLEKICRQSTIKAVYVTPHHQFPTTVSMKMGRRLQLVELSTRYGFAIIEDDYDHEFHFSTKSLFPIASLEGAANVIYISSLSKLIAPALRIGYVMGPPPFIAALAALRKVIDVQGDSIMENAVAELMEGGIIKKHARKAHAVYKDRREDMEQLLLHIFKDRIDFRKPEGGLAYWITFLKKIDTTELAAKLLTKGVSIMPTEPFSFHRKNLHSLRLGYASLTKEELQTGLGIIARQV